MIKCSACLLDTVITFLLSHVLANGLGAALNFPTTPLHSLKLSLFHHLYGNCFRTQNFYPFPNIKCAANSAMYLTGHANSANARCFTIYKHAV